MLSIARKEETQMHAMRSTSAAVCAITTAMVVCTAPDTAHASADWGINGTFAATSNGEWAQTNEVYRDEAVLRSTWTITTTCTSSITCTGTVDSDLGWSAPIFTKTGTWYVRHVVPRWQPCADGTFADGLQIFRFYRAGADLNTDPNSPTLIGEDTTTGPSGACGRNQSLEIRMPFKLTQVT